MCSLVVASLVPATAWAHPGHGVGGGDWSVHHYATEPVHLLSVLALVLVGAAPLLLREGLRAYRARANAKDAR
jgi:hypothetical protein